MWLIVGINVGGHGGHGRVFCFFFFFFLDHHLSNRRPTPHLLSLLYVRLLSRLAKGGIGKGPPHNQSPLQITRSLVSMDLARLNDSFQSR